MTSSIRGRHSTEYWAPAAAFLAPLAPPPAWPELDDRAVITPLGIETAARRLPWKTASRSSPEFAGKWGWLSATGLGALNGEVVAFT